MKQDRSKTCFKAAVKNWFAIPMFQNRITHPALRGKLSFIEMIKEDDKGRGIRVGVYG